MKLAKLHMQGNSIGIVIPRDVLKALKWTKGDHVVLEVRNDELLAYPLLGKRVRPRLRQPSKGTLSHAAQAAH